MIGIKDIVKPFGSQSFLIGVGVAALTYLIGPQLKESMKPLAVKGTQGIMALGSKTRQFLDDSTGTTRMKNMAEELEASSKTISELKEEQAVSNTIMLELKESVASLKDEISRLKRKKDPQQG